MNEYTRYMHKRSQARLQKGEGTRGRFGKLIPCYGCTKSAGQSYYSHPLSDCLSPKGIGWGDLALVLCKRCAMATAKMQEPIEFAEYAFERGALDQAALDFWRAKTAKGGN